MLADCFLIIGKPNQGGYSVFSLLHHFLLHLFWFLPHKRSRVSLFHVVYHIKSSFLEYLFYNKRERNWATNVYGFSAKYLHFLSSENTIFLKLKKFDFKNAGAYYGCSHADGFEIHLFFLNICVSLLSKRWV